MEAPRHEERSRLDVSPHRRASASFRRSIVPVSISKNAVSKLTLGAGVYDRHDASVAISATNCREINRSLESIRK